MSFTVDGEIEMSTALEVALSELDGIECDPVTRETIRALVTGYAEKWNDHQWDAVAVEQEFRLPIINPGSTRASSSRTFEHAGKIDLIVEDRNSPGDYYLCDHKTSSEDISDPGSDFWKQLFLSTQATHYQLACHQAGVKLAGCVWDVIRKPSIRPKKLDKKAQADITSGIYCGIVLDRECGHLESEDGYLYGLRVLSECRENPDRYFQRRSVPRNERELIEYARDLWGTATLIRRSLNDDAFYRTGATHACMSFGARCEYLDLCSGFSRVDSGQYVSRVPHQELTQSPEGIVTNSSLTTYRQCQRKYEYRHVYQIGLPGMSESLFFGQVMHKVLEAYWKFFLVPVERRLSSLFGGFSSDNSEGATASQHQPVLAGQNQGS